MTDQKYKKVRLKGNETFNFREGWLRKGMRCVGTADDNKFFSRNDVMEQLGVGSKMVKSIRYWLQATNLCEEKVVDGGKARAQYITPKFGSIIAKYDPFFDDIFTLFVLHYRIVSNEKLCVAWNLFFNEYEGKDFTKEEMVTFCKYCLDKRMDEDCTYAEKSLEDDCASVLKMYIKEEQGRGKKELVLPEDSLECPLSELGLLRKDGYTYRKTRPKRGDLDRLAVLYVIISNMQAEGKTSVSISDLVRAPNNIGRVFNLDLVTINEYLEELRRMGCLTVNRTAGLDMVYADNQWIESEKIMSEKVMIKYYEKAQGK